MKKLAETNRTRLREKHLKFFERLNTVMTDYLLSHHAAPALIKPSTKDIRTPNRN